MLHFFSFCCAHLTAESFSLVLLIDLPHDHADASGVCRAILIGLELPGLLAHI